ncbi:Acetyl-CoA acetyltransferase, mitochondrial [Phytophthora pseudosyringae]|uniref:Acetyl-CoA acetyltransferase, mitochondrial n=1 Tax=Phytophthora pseudosyringae TaxID=221518 RepID=A0A8T1VR87_9STRA|nr:Acetyl-CoA acetyltransferase, mitochondrial [Phytophthora pseudosyringae]
MLRRAAPPARRLFEARAFSTRVADSDVVIASYARTPITCFNGSFAPLHAPDLGAIANAEAVKRAGLEPAQIQEAFLGNVVSAGIGQAPARQSVLKAGFPSFIPCTTVNKVCASGMKALAIGAQSLLSGSQQVVLAGGFESMTNVPHYLPKARAGYRLGNGTLVDGVVHDGLWDPYNNQHMGMCGEKCAEDFGFSREDQDAYAIESYRRAVDASERGFFKAEITPVTIKSHGRRGNHPTVFDTDEEMFNTKPEKIPALRSAFKKDGTITAANASSLNDGAAAMVLMTGAKARELGVTPLARIRGFADAAQDPVEFTIAPSKAVPLAVHHAGLKMSDVDYHEINEAFSVVALANMRLMNIPHDRLNVNGGAVAIGHPIGVSGTRIVGTLIHILKEKDATIGCASICNGGGGAGAMVIERLN